MADGSDTLPVSFSSFVISMAQSILVHLGEVPDPSTQAKAVNLPLAQHTIDVLGMLEAKTANNLDADESALLASLLDEVRGKFVSVSQATRG